MIKDKEKVQRMDVKWSKSKFKKYHVPDTDHLSNTWLKQAFPNWG